MWHKIEISHVEIWELCENPTAVGFDEKNYISLEAQIQEKILQLQLQAEQQVAMQPGSSDTVNNSNPQLLPLPKVTLPTFSGDYLKWMQYHDLFTQMVDNQVIPTIQKMWYLKSSLSGEAERIIRHLPLSKENYNTAWTLVKARFHNTRALVASLVQKIIDQTGASSTVVAIKTLHDTTKECLLALQNLGVNTSSWGPLLVPLLLPKLDKQTRLLYEQSLAEPREILTTDELLQFLETRFQALEAAGFKEPQTHKTTSKACASPAVQQLSNKCKFCNKDVHPLYNCEAFRRAAVKDRIQAVQKLKACMNCLRQGHQASQCSSRSCLHCNRRHNTLLHLNYYNQEINQHQERKNASAREAQKPSGSLATINRPTTLLSSTQSRNSYVLLGAVKLNVTDAAGQLIECRALLDSGSQINLITQNLATKLKLIPEPMPMLIEGVGRNKNRATHSITTSINSRLNNFNVALRAFVIPKIVSNQPTCDLDISKWHVPKGLELADPQFYRSAPIDLLIGAEYYHTILSGEQIKFGQNLPVLQGTVFGWMCAGRVGNHSQLNTTCGVCSGDEDELTKILSKFWELDNFHEAESQFTEEEKKCEEWFTQHTKRNDHGRYVVRIPFKQDPRALGESMQGAINRFYSLERRLSKEPHVRQMYVDFMREYEELGHMERIDPETILHPKFVIPHHCIIKPDSSTTRLRVVFDASAKTSSGMSLNDIMHNGPVVQRDLWSILIRFRTHRFVFTTDVEKMYRQIKIHPDDQQFQLIVWRTDPRDQLNVYKLKTVTYGTRSAPYLATKCLQSLAMTSRTKFPLGAAALENDFYVDDGLSGGDSLTVAMDVKAQLITILSTAGMKLRKWCANHSQLLDGICNEDQEVDLDFSDDNCRVAIKTLGLTWLPTSDEFTIRTNRTVQQVITKRTVTSDLARVFDPLGLVAPVVVKAKIFVQQLWQRTLGWDDALPEDLRKQWTSFYENLDALQKIKIPRHLTSHKRATSVQLHIFTDASEKAYGAAAYLRARCENEIISVQLICSKSRVSPLKSQTIPRLELCAALLGAQLAKRVKSDLQHRDMPLWLWTDSEIVLHWINSDANKFQTFVAHRIAKIQEITLVEQWRHVSTSTNPADHLSRGVHPTGLQKCTPWFYGPMFLYGDEKGWPSTFKRELAVSSQQEVKKTTPILLASTTAGLVDIIYSINHHGSFKTLQRIVAYILRFVRILRKDTNVSDGTFSSNELSAALIIIVKAVQLSEFDTELKQLTVAEAVKPSSALYGLSPFIDEHKIIRVGGRLESSNLSFDSKHPMLLPYNDPIAKLIMILKHNENLHCSAQALLAHTRQQFWPIKGKLMSRSIVQHCVRCTRAKPKLYNQLMGNLPEDRVRPERPFFNSGVDFFGPLWIHYKIRGKRPCKAYVAIFCCFTTKAVHMEVVSDLTTEAFLGALQRFISRRGRCKTLHCDNATNFVGARNRLKELEQTVFGESNQNKVVQFCAEKQINFQFIPPRSPHFGGLWEAAVKSAKHLLLRSIESASLTYEELETVVIQAEAILNSRPLTPLSSDPNDLVALTPGHFLIGEPITSHPTGTTTGSKSSMITRWNLVNHIKTEFWSRWSKEYLNQLQYRHKWKNSSENVDVGNLVIIKDESRPPLHWPLGRIVKTYKGSDGLVRVVDVKTATGIIRRPIHNLAPLISDERDADENTRDIQPSKTSNEPSTKKRKTMYSTGSLLVIAMLMTLPLVLGNQVKIMKFSPEPGIHFENIGSVRTISTYWDLVSYYDMNPFKKEFFALSNGTMVLHHICAQLPLESGCRETVAHFQHVKEELAMDNQLLWKTRYKRGAINAIGNVANALFGVLDAEYAEKMQDTIRSIDNNEKYLLELLKNQTSIVDSTLNIMKLDENKTREKFERFDKKLAEITNQVVSQLKGEKIEEGQNKFVQMFNLLSIQLLLIASTLSRIQSSILDVLTDVHHGHIGPQLLSPTQLQNEIMQIKTQLPRTLHLPVVQEDLLSFYKHMEVQGGITTDYVIFRIKIPLVGSDEFGLYKLYPIPSLISNNTMVAIKTSLETMAVTAHGDKYFPISSRQLQSCLVLSGSNYLCPYPESVFNPEFKKYSCELNLFNNNTNSSCQLEKVEDDVWVQLNDKSQWMFALRRPTRLVTVCGTERSQIQIEGSGWLKLQSNCVVKHKSFTIQLEREISSEVRTSYTSFGPMAQLSNPNHIERILASTNEDSYKDHLNELTTLQEKIRNQRILELPSKIEANKQHHHIISYSALLLVIGILGFQCIKIGKKKWAAVRQKVPTPKPRRQAGESPGSTDFTVQIVDFQSRGEDV